MKNIMVIGLTVLFIIALIIGCGEGTPPTKTTPEPAKVITPTPPEQPKVSPPPQETPKEVTVYITRTGQKYHRIGCRYLSKSCIPMSLNEAKARYGACSVCNPPR